MANADITKYSSIKLDYLFCIIGISVGYTIAFSHNEKR